MAAPPETKSRTALPRTQTPAIIVSVLLIAAIVPAMLHHNALVPVESNIGSAIAEKDPNNSEQYRTRPKPLNLKINPNTATAAELCALRGIGPALSQRIIEYRQEHQAKENEAGPAFSRAEDLEQVRGIGPKTVEKLRPRLTFDD